MDEEKNYKLCNNEPKRSEVGFYLIFGCNIHHLQVFALK